MNTSFTPGLPLLFQYFRGKQTVSKGCQRETLALTRSPSPGRPPRVSCWVRTCIHTIITICFVWGVCDSCRGLLLACALVAAYLPADSAVVPPTAHPERFPAAVAGLGFSVLFPLRFVHREGLAHICQCGGTRESLHVPRAFPVCGHPCKIRRFTPGSPLQLRGNQPASTGNARSLAHRLPLLFAAGACANHRRHPRLRVVRLPALVH
jgi:hypothetical protein